MCMRIALPAIQVLTAECMDFIGPIVMRECGEEALRCRE
jgi:hypothetical protein